MIIQYGKLGFFFARFCQAMLISCILSLFPLNLSAEVTTDGTAGPTLSLSGPDYHISHELGTTAGRNLFHSFQHFSIAQTESATFTGPDFISNVISRVTGGEVSFIDGVVRSQVGQADFFFINPAGIVFGPNAVVDVPGAFHVTTADELRFADGNIFSSVNPDASILTVAEPSSFGFLAPQPAAIVLNGARLAFAPESTVSLAGGDVGVSSMGEIKAQGGSVRLVGVGQGPNQVAVSDGMVTAPALGNVKVDLFSTIDVSGFEGDESVVVRGGRIQVSDSEVAADHYGFEDSPGKIFIQGEKVDISNGKVHALAFSDGRGNDIVVQVRELKMFNANMATSTLGSGNSGAIDITANGSIDLNMSKIDASSYSSGQAGTISLWGNELKLLKSSYLFADAYELGNAGMVGIEIRGSALVDESSSIEAGTGDDGSGGKIEFSAGSLDLLGGSVIFAGSYGDGSGGEVAIDVDENFLIEDFSFVSTENYGFGTGTAGDIHIKAANLELINSGTISASTLYGTCNAGTVTIDVEDRLHMVDHAEISSSSYAQGPNGIVIVNAGELTAETEAEITSLNDVSSESSAGMVEVDVAGTLELLTGAEIACRTFSSVNAGPVNVNAGNLIIDGRDSIYTGINSLSNSDGDAGIVNVTVEGMLKMFNNARISSNACGEGSSGSVTVKSNGLIHVQGGSYIGASTLGEGHAGNVTIKADEFRIEDPMSIVSSIAVENSIGNAGIVDLEVEGNLGIFNGAFILSNSLGKGDAGEVKVSAGGLSIDGREQLTGIMCECSFGSQGKAGKIGINVNGLLEMLNGAVISSSTFSEGNAGNILINAQDIMVDGGTFEHSSGIMSDTRSGSQGDAGDLEVNVKDRLTLLDGAVISSGTNSKGNGGRVLVTSNEVTIDGKGTDRSTGIYTSTAVSEVQGNAGSVQVLVGEKLQLLNNGAISSSTNSKGNAGKVMVHAKELWIDGLDSALFTGVSSRSSEQAVGHVGDVIIEADVVKIKNKGQIDISSSRSFGVIYSQPWDSRIHIDTYLLHLDQDAGITAESKGNVPAAAIELNTGKLMVEHGSSITTSAEEADGGPITIQSDTLVLRDALITTSVTGISGNGGNIVLTGRENDPSDVIVFSAGFVQANTAAQAAHGGDIFIDARAAIAEGDALLVGGEQRQIFEPGKGLNLIQAAAPGGEQGAIEITAPELDISGSLVPTAVGFIQPVQLATDPCSVAGGQGMNSLVFLGSGGIPADSGNFLLIYSGNERLDQLLKTDLDKEENMTRELESPLEKTPERSVQ